MWISASSFATRALSDPSVYSQHESASIVGTIRDSLGAAIRGVTVSIRSIQTNESKSVRDTGSRPDAIRQHACKGIVKTV